MQANNDGIHKGHRQRMRAKLKAHGARVFDTYELLEMLLYYVVPYKDTNPIAKRLTDKCDVTEEFVRLKSHFVHFRNVMEQENEPGGRTLDFITQEIFREVNTLGNKAPVPAISKRIVMMKTEVEKIREQVQNIE